MSREIGLALFLLATTPLVLAQGPGATRTRAVQGEKKT